MREPVLKAASMRRPGTSRAGNPIMRRYRLRALGGLHYIRGNKLPYFSLTGELERAIPGGNWYMETCGAIHEELLAKFPSLKPLADLHLSDINGEPMHAEANGWYNMAGALGGAGEGFHRGNGKLNINGEYRTPTPDECLVFFAQHARISEQEALALRNQMSALIDENGVKVARACFGNWIEAQKPRWKAEAERVIADLNLKVYGDEWKGEQA